MIAMRPATTEPAAAGARELVLADLLHDFGELTQLLCEELERENRLDAFLLAAGMNQVLEDYLHRDFGSLTKVAANLRGARSALGQSLTQVRRAAIRARALTPGERSLITAQFDLADLVLVLAREVAGEPFRRGITWRDLLARCRAVPAQLSSEILRLPTCFRSLDLKPDDMQHLAARFARRMPNRAQRIILVGIRTSGSYLAPLQAAYLLRQGFERVALMTVRPGDELLSHERRTLKQAAEQQAIAIVADDPPSSGRAVARVGSLLRAAGFPLTHIVLSLPLLGTEAEMPEPLRQFDRVVLERDEWAVEKQLHPGLIRMAIQGMSGLENVASVRRLHLPSIDDPWEEAVDRRHARGLYEVELQSSNGRPIGKRVYAKGIGLGYLGRHSLAVAKGIGEYAPELYGLRDGLLFRAWQPNGRRMSAKSRVDHMPERIAGYVHARGQALSTPRDLSLRMVGRQAVWQRTADVLMEPFGRLRLLLRPLVHRLAKDLLRVEQPSVVDGSMGLHHWFAGPDQLAVKVDNDERAFSNEDIYSYDATYDLGAAAASLRAQRGPEAAQRARGAYELIIGKRVDEERWFLYQLLTAKLQRRTLRANLIASRPDGQAELIRLLDAVETALEDAQREYMRACFLSDVGPRPDGALCAIDLDGTLETAPLGYTAIGPSGALALRVLAKHGYRAVLASGRSLDEVRHRVESYRLAAGVAEYGAVVFDAARGESVELLTEADRVSLSHMHSVLAGMDGVHLDRRYTRSVRAFTIDKQGRRRGLPPDTISAAIALSGMRQAVAVVPGWSQTDFVSSSVNKADGIRVVAGRLGVGSHGALLELAVGDASTDLPLFRIARLACVPANGDSHLRKHGVRFMSGHGQEGVIQAVGSLIGHEPGHCKLCRLPGDGASRRQLLDLMAGYDKRGWRRARNALSLAWGVWRAK